MLKTFPIEFIRQAIEQTLAIAHNDNVNLFGGKEQINITSFYEQLKNQDEVDRFVETYRDIVDQQNSTGLIGNGVILSPENPTITNLYSSLIIPFNWTCSIRCTLANRDQMLITINNLISELKGRKCDIAQLDCIDENEHPYSTPFMVGTIGENDGAPTLRNGDYIGETTNTYSGTRTYESELQRFGDLYVSSILITFENAYQSEIKSFTCNYPNTTIEKVSEDVYRARITAPYTPLQIPPATLTISYSYSAYDNVNTYITNKLNDLSSQGIQVDNVNWLYIEYQHKLCVAYKVNLVWQTIEEDGTYEDIIFPPEHTSFEKFKLSMSFDSLRCDEPRTLNSEEYCEISFGGSCTLVSDKVALGNDLIKIGVIRKQIKAETPITYTNQTIQYLEPLEMPSGNSANTQLNQLVSNKFKTNSHTDGIGLNIQYSFIADFNIDLIKWWFDYARYGDIENDSDNKPLISPNIIYEISEFWSSWGIVKNKKYLGKIVDDIEIENTESDTLTLGITMQVQGEN